MNNNEEIKRHIELEFWLSENYPNTDSNTKALLYFLDNFDSIDADYLYEAYVMPRKEIENDLEMYYNCILYNKMEEILFINCLMNKYDVTESEIIKRIRDIREMNTLENDNIQLKKRKNYKKSCIIT